MSRVTNASSSRSTDSLAWSEGSRRGRPIAKSAPAQRAASRGQSTSTRTLAIAGATAAIGALYIWSTVLTPLYPLYEREFHFSQLGRWGQVDRRRRLAPIASAIPPTPK